MNKVVHFTRKKLKYEICPKQVVCTHGWIKVFGSQTHEHEIFRIARQRYKSQLVKCGPPPRSRVGGGPRSLSAFLVKCCFDPNSSESWEAPFWHDAIFQDSNVVLSLVQWQNVHKAAVGADHAGVDGCFTNTGALWQQRSSRSQTHSGFHSGHTRHIRSPRPRFQPDASCPDCGTRLNMSHLWWTRGSL